VAARKTVFFEPTVNTIHSRMIVCQLEGPLSAELWAVHLSGSGHDVQELGDRLNERSSLDDVIVAGDFNFDLRRKEGSHGRLKKDLTRHPRVKALFDNSERLLPDRSYGSCNKMRSPFQAQITKIMSRDFALKDYVCVGRSLQVGEDMTGLIDETESLPNERFPSDHAMIAAEIWAVRNTGKTEEDDDEEEESIEATPAIVKRKP
jgi:hypothetical protein